MSLQLFAGPELDRIRTMTPKKQSVNISPMKAHDKLYSAVLSFLPSSNYVLAQEKPVLLFFECCSAVLRSVSYVLPSIPVDIG